MADPNELAEQMGRYSDAELASAKADRPTSLRGLLADQELARRDRLKQHALDLKLIAEQVQWMKFSAILSAAAAIIAAIVGAIAGAILTLWLQRSPIPMQPEPPPRSSQQESAPSTSVDRTKKAESVPSKSP